ncbi:MAG: hypothetical protein WDN76_00180 [Alphaproteobacteria bacterium]
MRDVQRPEDRAAWVRVENCHGDAIKTSEANTVSFRDLAVQWTAPAGGEASAIVAETTQNALFDNVVARGATNAGLRLSEAQQVIVQNSTFAQSTIGAAIENSVGVDFTRTPQPRTRSASRSMTCPARPLGRTRGS